MRAAEVKCPKCGKSPSDIAPDFELGPGEWTVSADTLGHCENGHRLLIRGWKAAGSLRSYFEIEFIPDDGPWIGGKP